MGRDPSGNGDARILLVEDHGLVRKGIRAIIEGQIGYGVIEADSPVSALAALSSYEINLVLLDLRLGEESGLSVLEEIRRRDPDLPVVIISTFARLDYVKAAIEAGANGYVLKDADVRQLKEAIETALSGRGLYLHPSVAQSLARWQMQPSISESLTARESDVLGLIARGSTNEQVASALHITNRTVKSHLTSIFRKLGVSNRTEAATYAVRNGLVDPL